MYDTSDFKSQHTPEIIGDGCNALSVKSLVPG